MEAGQDLDQGGLARAVLAEQPVHLALCDLKRDVVERTLATEALGQPGQQQGERFATPDRRPCRGRLHLFHGP